MERDYELFRSVILGAAIGDALGLHYELYGSNPREEWMSEEEEIRVVYVGDSIAYSDDTEMTLILAETIIESCGFNPALFAKKLAEKADIDNPIRFYGTGTSIVVEEIRKGVHWLEASKKVYGGEGNYGNGGAIRVSPIPLFYESKKSVELMAVAQAMITHAHPLGKEAARLQALAIHYSIEGVKPLELPILLGEETLFPQIRERLESIPDLLGETPSKIASLIGNGVAGYESVPAALLCHAWSRGDPYRSTLCAISLGGDTDSIASMAAAVSAAYSRSLGGLKHWVWKLEGRETIEKIARELYEKYRECRGGQVEKH